MAQSHDDDFTVSVEESEGGINPGDTCTGTIQELKTHEWENPDPNEDDALYFDIRIEENENGLNLGWTGYPMGSPDNPRVTQNTELGKLVMRMGYDLSEGESLSLGEVFSPGTQVEFEVEEGDETDDGDFFLDVVRESVRPVGAEAPVSPTAEEDEVDDDLRDEVLALAADYEGEEESSLKAALAKESGEHYKTYKQMVDDGEISIQSGLVTIP